MPEQTRRRNYDTRLIKRDVTYTVDEVAELLGVHVNTVRLWLANGLNSIDDRRPILVHGSDLIRFLNKKRASRRQKCAVSEFYCFRCRAARGPRNNEVTIERQSGRVLMLTALCAECGTKVFKAASPRHLAIYEEIFVAQPRRPAHIIVCEQPADNCDLARERSS